MQERKGFPFWGAIALPAGLLWGTLLGIGIGYLSGNAFIGGAIGAALGIGRRGRIRAPSHREAKPPDEARLARLHEAGVPLFAGTDTPNLGVVPGVSLREEIVLLASAGLATEGALAAATSAPGRGLPLQGLAAIVVGAPDEAGP